MNYFIFDNKRIYYNEFGEGTPLLFLHGNTASSNMLIEFAEKYKNEFKVILIDFLGHGKSERLEEFPADLWYYEAQQVICFLREKQYSDVHIIGSSGGAIVAINVALEAPELVSKVIADSFEGKCANKAFTENVIQDRKQAKQDENARMFFGFLHGPDWKQILDNDTNAIIKHEKEIVNFFHKSLRELRAEILLTGSKEDEFMSVISNVYFDEVYGEMIKEIGHGRIHLFNSGGHPAMLTNQTEFYEVSMEFFK